MARPGRFLKSFETLLGSSRGYPEQKDIHSYCQCQNCKMCVSCIGIAMCVVSIYSLQLTTIISLSVLEDKSLISCFLEGCAMFICSVSLTELRISSQISFPSFLPLNVCVLSLFFSTIFKSLCLTM